MAELVGLKMQGIRSIEDEPHLISFLSPLTIIQGANGTGKTTIIEALNYVTTGALPAGKMPSFIHNMKLTNRPRVDALVQLQFKDVKGNKCTATKRMTSCGAKTTGKTQTKSDEFTLVVTDKFGNNKSLSSKVADFNKEMLNLLGVPKAILEHVIFCHQEESNWPLSEPKELKVRFDAIFEVTKYVKALDNIKKNIKEMELQIKVIDAEIPHLDANRQSYQNLLISYDQEEATLNEMKSAVVRDEGKKKAIDDKVKELSKDVELAKSSKHEADILANRVKLKTEFINSISIDDYAGSREELVEELQRLLRGSQAGIEKENAVLVKQLQEKLRKCEEECRTASKSASFNEQKSNQLQNQLAIKKSQLAKHNATISEVSADRDYIESRLEEVRLMLSKTRGDLGQIDGCLFLYDKWKDEITQTKACPLCERSTNKAESEKLVTKLKAKQEALPTETRSLQMNVRKYEEEEKKLTRVLPYLSMAQALEAELPKLEEQAKHQEDVVERQRKAKEKFEEEALTLKEKLQKTQEAQMSVKSQVHEIRKLEDQLKKMDLMGEVADIKKQLDDVQSKGQNQDALLKENDELLIQASRLNNRIQQKSGELIQLEKKLANIKKELDNPRYKNAKTLHINKLIDRAVIIATMDDLSKYWKVLDDAIISFHQQKMEQINMILRELWTRVYKGNDIEAIKIRSQPVSGGEKKKSYDYSVVMIVDSVEIDMRDHCSAGQKVLAAILIRIALADVFAGNCPILALDEPTTNLDADKVENVGLMLKQLIEVRNNIDYDSTQESQSQSLLAGSIRSRLTQPGNNKSLQLLVITHDKRLVDLLYLACKPEWIYGLSKDENGISRIKKHRRVCDSLDYEEF
ncbi:AAA domain-containing protein [Ditylenchus destructor]|uniref:AAA domain-containing protein n=1 Tax=Ditylenchus destructor TaxID=166010 RepID=A0AAD4N202_9BILA|nr:AAA domain-containing protein [Ditylenchus destructor]